MPKVYAQLPSCENFVFTKVVIKLK